MEPPLIGLAIGVVVALVLNWAFGRISDYFSPEVTKREVQRALRKEHRRARHAAQDS